MTASFRNFIPARPILLDLACGTGSLSIELARLGYDVVGTDASQQMLSEAMLKKEIALYGENFEREEPSDPGIAKLLFLCQPMQELDMYGTLDAAVCALDSLNHVTDPQVVQRIFDRVSLFLNPGAVFVFDVNSVYKHREVLGNNVFVFDREDVYCVWQNSLQPDGVQVQMDLDFFAYHEDDDTYTAPARAFASAALYRRGDPAVYRKERPEAGCGPMRRTALIRWRRRPSGLCTSRKNKVKRNFAWGK